MKTLASMSPAEMSAYLDFLNRATASVVPPDGRFVVLLFGDDGMGHWTCNVGRASLPAALREAADAIEANGRSGRN